MFWQWQKGWAVREGAWKLIKGGSYGLGRGRLDDLALVNLDDPKPESTNYLQERPDVAKRLQAHYDDWAEDVFSVYKP